MLTTDSTFGHYKILERLGSGAMGEIYKAIDSHLERTVALKVINDRLSKSPEYRERLAREAKAAAKLDSPYIVKVWEHDEIDGQPYISLEYVSGKTLREIAMELTLDQKLNFARQIALGLQAAHSKGLIHRDLKPDNIKAAENCIKILDFGLAKMETTESVDRMGNIEGTLYYLSPEQARGEEVTCRSDLFSFGVLLYELLTGKRPFEGEYAAAIFYSILYEDPPAPSTINKEIPPHIDELILKLLAKQGSERIQRIEDVIKILDQPRQEPAVEWECKPPRTRQTVTVIDLKNLSGDDAWEYFCIGFTEDLISELSRRTDLVISAEPSTSYARDVRDVFRRCRSDFVILGSLMKWQDKIKLNLKIYGAPGNNFISGSNYETAPDKIFEILAQAVRETSSILEGLTGCAAIEVEDYFRTDIKAYEYYLKGKNYYQTNKPDDLEIAEQMFLRALEIDPNLAYAHSGLSDVYAFQYMAYYDRTLEKIEKARAEALRAIEISPDLPEGHRSLGRCLMFMEDFPGAEAALIKAIELNPKYAMGYRTMAWLKEMEGDHEKAVYWARQTLKYAPNDLETLLLLSLINIDLKKYTAAMASLQRAIELAPDYGRAHYNLAYVYIKLGALDVALENIQLAIKYKGDPNAHLYAGNIYLSRKEYDKAIEMFEESRKAGFFPFIALYFLGFAEKKRGNIELAESYFRQTIETARCCELKDRGNPYYRVYCAMALAAINEKAKSLEYLEALENQWPPNGEIFYGIARGYALLGDAAKATLFLKRSLAEHAGPTEKEIINDPHFDGLAIEI
jgi:serine/threonine protein kinase/Tfp pilus assembly protein PilF